MAIEGSYKSLLGGASEQAQQYRQEGQVSIQENMLSDMVRGLRRRPGTVRSGYLASFDLRLSRNRVAQYSADMGYGALCILVDTRTGWVYSVGEGVLNGTADTVVGNLVGTYSYLVASKPSSIRFATVGDELFIANVEMKPSMVRGAVNPANSPNQAGYFFIRTGAFSKTYSLTMHAPTFTRTVTYTTPDGTDPSHAAMATPEYIAAQLAAQVNPSIMTGVSAVTTGAYVFVRRTEEAGTISLTSNSGNNYISTSKKSQVSAESDLPATLHEDAEGYIMAVGSDAFKKYYRYDAGGSRWVESGEYGSPAGLSNMPKCYRYAVGGGTLVEVLTPWKGRTAGDDETNPTPEFVNRGITGIGSFQGRLVILAGPYVTLSASAGKTHVFYRETVTTLLATDPINVASASASGATFAYVTPYNSDLILHASGHQAVMPSRGQAVTPANATVVLTTSYESSLSAEPVAVGRSLFYTAPRSATTYSVMEMVPSGFTESQYDSQDVTNHIPEYLTGRCRNIVTSSTNNICLFLSDTDLGQVVVHEYLWNGTEKVHATWHEWVFKQGVISAWFVRETLNLLVQHPDSTNAEIVRLSLRTAAQPDNASLYVPCVDFARDLPVIGADTLSPYVQLTSHRDCWYYYGSVSAAVVSGGYVGSFVGVKRYDPATNRLYLEAVPNQPGIMVRVGVNYLSRFSPTPPTIRDRAGLVIDTNKVTIVRYSCTLRYTAPFYIDISDRGGSVTSDFYGPGVSYTSQELGLMQAPLTANFKLQIPCRVEAESSKVVFSSTSVGDLNILGMSYVLRAHRKIKRI